MKYKRFLLIALLAVLSLLLITTTDAMQTKDIDVRWENLLQHREVQKSNTTPLFHVILINQVIAMTDKVGQSFALLSHATPLSEITSFVANRPDGGTTVSLSWQTGSEFNIGAFNVWRSTVNLTIDENEQLIDPNSNATKVNTTAIAATCSGNTTTNYSFDDTTADPNVTYYYYIEAIRCDTGSGFYGDGQLPNNNGNGLEVQNGSSLNTPTPLPTNTLTSTPVAIPTNTSTATVPLPPIVVEISSFFANWPDGSTTVTLSWQTGTEFNIGAFNVWRSTVNLTIDENEQLIDPNSNATKVNTTAIAATCSGNTTGNYSFDDTTADPNVTYYYYIEAIRCDSGSGFYGDGQLPNNNGNGLEVQNGSSVNTPTPLPSATASHTSTPTPSATASNTSTPTRSATASHTSTPTPSATASHTSTPTPSATASSTSTPTPSATASHTSTPTPSATATSSPSATSTPSATWQLYLPIMID